MRQIFLRIALSILFIYSINSVEAQAVISDPSFGASGVRTLNFPDQASDPNSACVVPLPNNQIITGTYATIRINNGALPSRLHFKIMKLNENGRTDL